MVNVAIVGLGWWGKRLSKTLSGNPLLRIVPGVEPDRAALHGFSESCGFPIAGYLDAAVADPDVDAVILTTPHSLHDAQIERVADAGTHIFCEKPLSLTRAAAARSVGICRDKGLQLGVGHERPGSRPSSR